MRKYTFCGHFPSIWSIHKQFEVLSSTPETLIKCFMSICNTRPRCKPRSISTQTPPSANHIIDSTLRITSTIKIPSIFNNYDWNVFRGTRGVDWLCDRVKRYFGQEKVRIASTNNFWTSTRGKATSLLETGL